MAKKLKVAVIREEFVALTGDATAAVILNQMLYWTERVGDFDKFIAEEKERDPDLEVAPRNGWIYKTADQLLDEIMLSTSSATIARRLKILVDQGWLWRRHNPKHKWDHTWQYRANLDKINADLATLGYTLQGWRFDAIIKQPASTILHGDESTDHRDATIPETTSEITIEKIQEGIPESRDSGAVALATDAESGPPVPSSFEGWKTLVRGGKNKPAVLRRMFCALYPNHDPPEFSYLGKMAKRLHAGYLAELLWKNSVKPPSGDVLAYIQKVAKYQRNDNGSVSTSKVPTYEMVTTIDAQGNRVRRKARL